MRKMRGKVKDVGFKGSTLGAYLDTLLAGPQVKTVSIIIIFNANNRFQAHEL